MGQYLSRHTVADTHQFDQMRSTLVDVYDARSFVTQRDHAQFSAKAGYFHFASSHLSYCAYGSPVQVEFRDDDLFRFQFVISGIGQTAVGQCTAESNCNVIVSGRANATFDFGHDFEQLVLQIDQTALERDAAMLLGARPPAPISFDLSVDSRTGQAKRLREHILYSATSVDCTLEAIPAPLLKEMDQTIRLAVLYGVPNSYSSRLSVTPKDSAPWQVKRIEEWIDVNWQENITIEKIVEITGVSARSIFATFRSTRGYGPMAYLKKVRLNAARRMLLEAAPGVSVTGAGFACNFFNLGQFASDYRSQFGELPSETLRRARTNVS